MMPLPKRFIVVQRMDDLCRVSRLMRLFRDNAELPASLQSERDVIYVLRKISESYARLDKVYRYMEVTNEDIT